MDKAATRGFIKNDASGTHRCSWSRESCGAQDDTQALYLGVNFEELLMVVGFGQDLLMSSQKVVVREVVGQKVLGSEPGFLRRGGLSEEGIMAVFTGAGEGRRALAEVGGGPGGRWKAERFHGGEGEGSNAWDHVSLVSDEMSPVSSEDLEDLALA